MPPLRRVVALASLPLLCLALSSPRAIAGPQGSAPDADATDAQPSPDPTETNERADVPPAVRLGHRVLAVRQRLPVVPVLMLVPDADAFLRTLETWQLGATWPVLIDDGSDAARENIARFVRAFEPQRVYRWNPPEQPDAPALSRAERVEAMVAHAWGATPDTIDEKWGELGFAPPGIVVTSENDQAWVAGAALAAGHGQPIAWTTGYRNRVSMRMKPGELDTLERDVRAGLEATGRAWKDLGDEIEAVTLCLNAPGRIEAPPGEEGDFALTDRVGRHPDGRRYAWCGIIFGDEQAAAYRAMCSLFLAHDRGWVFDGYGPTFPEQFAADHALPMFERMGFDVTFTAAEGGTLGAWRARCRAGIGGGFVHVNSAGYPTWFQLARKERAPASDTPLLRQPAVVHFIHSFSAQLPDNPTTIAARWLENGAYAYAGAVDEPYLGAFVPPGAYFTRLFSGAPFGAAPRLDNAPPWKVQVIGDPLAIAGPPRQHRELADVEGAVAVEDEMRQALQGGRIGAGVSLLVTLGRDDDALRLTRAALEQDTAPDHMETIARAAIYPAFRDWDAELFVRLYERLPQRVADDEGHTAMLWQILRPTLGIGEPDERAVGLLRRHIRPESVVSDATDLRGPIGELYGRDAVDALFLEQIERAKRDKTKKRLRDAMEGR